MIQVAYGIVTHHAICTWCRTCIKRLPVAHFSTDMRVKSDDLILVDLFVLFYEE